MKENSLLKQRIYRKKTSNKDIKRYEKTPKGFLMRLYRNMQSRVEGVQKVKFHLYEGKELLDRHTFYQWGLMSNTFISLYINYTKNNYDRKLAPSVDRKDSSKGYYLDNMEWVTMSENSRRGSKSKKGLKYEVKTNT